MKKAFTLIEVLVVIAIIAVLTGVGIIALVSARQNRQVSTVAQRIQSIIMESRAYALAQPANFPSSTNNKFLRIKIAKNERTIEFFAAQGVGNADLNPSPINPLINDISIPKNIVIENQYSIDINISDPNLLGQIDVTPAGTAGPNKYCLGLHDTGEQAYYHLNIYKYGEVDVAKGKCK